MTLFVFYGTLRRGERAFLQLDLATRLRFVGACTFHGRLYDLGDYPGYVLGEGVVQGDLFRCVDDGIIAELDAFEGYDPGDLDGSIYVREPMSLADRVGEAFVYRYAGLYAGRPLIESGDWPSYRKQRSGAFAI